MPYNILMNTKALIESRQFWIAAVQALIAIITIAVSNYPGLEAAGWLALVKSGLDIWLRTQTSTPISGVLKR